MTPEPNPAPSEREYEALTAGAELGRKRGEWLTEAYARISELEVENRRLREALGQLHHLVVSPGDMGREEIRSEGRRVIEGVLDA